VLLTWEGGGPNASYTLYRALNPGDSYMPIAMGKGSMYLDSADFLGATQELLYSLESDGRKVEAEAGATLDPYVLEVIGAYYDSLRFGLSGIECSVYRLTDTKRPCPECWSDILKKRTKSVCGTCDGWLTLLFLRRGM